MSGLFLSKTLRTPGGNRVCVWDRCLNGAIATIFLFKQKGKRGKKWNDEEGCVCVCVSLVKSVLGIFLVHKIRQLETRFSKLSLKPLSPGVEAEGIGKNRLLSARSP